MCRITNIDGAIGKITIKSEMGAIQGYAGRARIKLARAQIEVGELLNETRRNPRIAYRRKIVVNAAISFPCDLVIAVLR